MWNNAFALVRAKRHKLISVFARRVLFTDCLSNAQLIHLSLSYCCVNMILDSLNPLNQTVEKKVEMRSKHFISNIVSFTFLMHLFRESLTTSHFMCATYYGYCFHPDSSLCLSPTNDTAKHRLCSNRSMTKKERKKKEKGKKKSWQEVNSSKTHWQTFYTHVSDVLSTS